MLAVGTRAGLVCLWQLAAGPDSQQHTQQQQQQHSHAHINEQNGDTANQQHSNGAAVNGASAPASAASAAPRRLGAWVRVLSHGSQSGVPVDHLAFSPCGRWLASASSARPGFVLFDVAAALSSPHLDARSGGGGEGSTHICRPLSGWLERGHGVDVLRWSPRGDALLLASSPKQSGAFSTALRSVADKLCSKTKQLLRPDIERAGTLPFFPSPSPAPASECVTAAADTVVPPVLPAGSLSLWNPLHWTQSSWETASPVSDAAFARSASLLHGPPQTEIVVLLALQGSSIVQSATLPLGSSLAAARALGGAQALAASSGGSSVLSGSSASASAALRINFSPVDGLPPSRQPQPASEGLQRFEVGGASVRRLAWSEGGERLVVAFDERYASPPPTSLSSTPVAGESGVELAAVVALHRDATRALQALPVGVVRGPVCPCRGRLHRQLAAEQQRQHEASNREPSPPPAQQQQDEGDELERKYDNSAAYPRLTVDAVSEGEFTCRARNVPVHVTFLRAPSAAGDILAVAWKLGQISFLPLGNPKQFL